jgi:hypothetical protein
MDLPYFRVERRMARAETASLICISDDIRRCPWILLIQAGSYTTTPFHATDTQSLPFPDRPHHRPDLSSVPSKLCPSFPTSIYPKAKVVGLSVSECSIKMQKSFCSYKRMSKASLKVQYANLARLYMRACAVCCAELSINGENGPVKI